MLNFCSLCSGSSGNCLFIQSDKSKILIDAGASAKAINLALASIHIDINDIDAILVTHEHTDHTKSIGTISKKYNIPIYANKETWNAMPEQQAKINNTNIKTFKNEKKFKINDLTFYPFSTPHDAANPCGFNICYLDKKISIATDLGHVTNEIMNCLNNSTFLFLESNYEPEILRSCRYPYYLKTRIAGDNGHLSNEMASKVATKLVSNGLKNISFGHLSKENNFPDLAYTTFINELKNNNLDPNSLEINIASRDKPGKILNLI